MSEDAGGGGASGRVTALQLGFGDAAAAAADPLWETLAESQLGVCALGSMQLEAGAGVIERPPNSVKLQILEMGVKTPSRFFFFADFESACCMSRLCILAYLANTNASLGSGASHWLAWRRG